MGVAVKVMRAGCAMLAAALASTGAQAQSADADLKAFAVHVNRTPQQSWPGYGICLGNGLILTASHVPGTFAAAKPRVVIAGQDLPAGLVREGNLENVDLTLLSVDPISLPVRLRMRRMPLCERQPYAGEAVVVAIPEGTERSRVLPSQAIPAELRGRFGTAIADVATTGNSGSGVFDAANLCLLGIISRKISVGGPSARFGAPVVATRDIAKYFVPAPVIKAFIPPGVTYWSAPLSLRRADADGNSEPRGTAAAVPPPVKFG
jgi:hypothetical protein